MEKMELLNNINNKDAVDKEIQTEYFVNGDKVVIREIYNLIFNTSKLNIEWNNRTIYKSIDGMTTFNNVALYQFDWLQKMGILKN